MISCDVHINSTCLQLQGNGLAEIHTMNQCLEGRKEGREGGREMEGREMECKKWKEGTSGWKEGRKSPSYYMGRKKWGFTHLTFSVSVLTDSVMVF